MSEPAMPTVGDLVADKYEVVDLIGEGGMGSVFLATHRMTQKRVALKWMLPELARNEDAVQRFLREAQAAGRIAHPNVVDIYDVGEHAGSYFLVMEYLHGEPLSDAMESRTLDPSKIVDIILPCLRGVGAAHRKGVIHRDLKPDNIFLCRNDEGAYLQPKVLDFGISKLSGSDNDVNPRLTRTGAVMGTPYYMSPEQIRGSHNVDGRCDVYAFGVILYEAMTGQVPFNAETYSALVLEIATGTAKSPVEVNPGIPPELADVVMKAMAREPEDRYESVTALGAALEPFAGSVRFTVDRMDPTGPQLRNGSATSTPFATDQTILEVPGRKRGVGKWLALGGLAAVGAVVVLTMGPSEAEGPAAASGGIQNRPVDQEASGNPLTGEAIPDEPAPDEQTSQGSKFAQDEASEHDRDGVVADGSGGQHSDVDDKRAADQAGLGAAAEAREAAAEAKETAAEAKETARAQRARAAARRRARRTRRDVEASPPEPTAERPTVVRPVVAPVPAPQPRPVERKPPARRPGRTGSLSVDDF